MTDIHLIDDYNQRIHRGGQIVGTVTTQFGNATVRHAWKLLIEYD